MSTKKKRRLERRQARKEPRSRFSPATLFTVVIGLCILAIVLYAVLSGGPEAPWPGAVWSDAHQHWH